MRLDGLQATFGPGWAALEGRPEDVWSLLNHPPIKFPSHSTVRGTAIVMQGDRDIPDEMVLLGGVYYPFDDALWTTDKATILAEGSVGRVSVDARPHFPSFWKPNVSHILLLKFS